MAYKSLSKVMIHDTWMLERKITEDCYKCVFCGRKFLFREAYHEHTFTCEERQKVLYPVKKEDTTKQVSILEF